MTIQQLDTFLFTHTASEKRHLQEGSEVLSARYRQIPLVEYEGRKMYRFTFNSLFEERSICVNKESRFTRIPEHVHAVIEFLYVYSGECVQFINGRRITLRQGDICLLDTNVPHSIEPLGAEDIVITIDMRKEYLMQGFLQRLGSNGIINRFLLNTLSENACHDQCLLFERREEQTIHPIIQNILREYYAPQICSDKMVDAYMALLFCEILRQYKNRAFSPDGGEPARIIPILEYIEANSLTVTLQSAAQHFGFHPNYLSTYIKRETGRSFKELVIFQRMGQACFLLANTDLPIYEVAARVGYDNLGFFYKKFEEIYKMKPAFYRKSSASKNQLSKQL